MAARGVGSRRRSEDLIRAGRVMVNGHVTTAMGTKVDPRTAEVRVDGKLVRPQRLQYIVLNKPRGYITTTSDERGRHTVMELIQSRERVYPVGRLDRETEGLLLLTNDGEVANRVMHPRYGMTKEYHVLTFSRPNDTAFRRIASGIDLDGKLVIPDEFRILRETREGLILKVVLHEGINRVVRRMMEEAGIPVERLRRVRVGPLTLAGLTLGSWRELTDGERTTLFEALRLGRSAPAFPGAEPPRSPARGSSAVDSKLQRQVEGE
ncbi:MAG: rRNA pseudouridine synthase [Chloroflexia bacterium]|nr:rRNA pseudouridine synthase [Chloroflexia bacterium]